MTTIFIASLAFGQIKLEDLRIDTSITGFHLAANFQGTNVFTKNGASDLNTINPSAFSFTLAADLNPKDAIDQLEQLMDMSKQNGFKISEIVRKDTILNGYKAYYISYTERDSSINYENLVFNAFVVKEGTLILFTSGDLDQRMYLDKFKRTFYSIKL